MKGVSLFAGVGGLDLGFERAGGETVLQVEIDQFCQRVLAKHWPDVRRMGDVRFVTANDCATADVLFGGFPCQPVSLAGGRLGQDDERWLWPEFKRLIRDVRPRYAVMENVPGILSLGLSDVLGDLSELGYDARWSLLSACSLGAPHPRQRVFIVAYRSGLDGSAWDRVDQGGTWGASAPTRRFPGVRVDRAWGRAGEWNAGEPDVDRVAHGVPGWVDRLHALGNAVVPQVAEYVFRRLFEFDAEWGAQGE